MKPLEIVVDPNRCAGCDICRENAPKTFEIGEDAKAYVKDPAGDPREVILHAAAGCPMDAITVRDPETGEQLVPAVR